MHAKAFKIDELGFLSYEVLFTNPICNSYSYTDAVYSNSDERLYQKTQNAFCKKADLDYNILREGSPHFRLKQWINSPKTKEILFTFLSFSNGDLYNDLCEAAKRDVKITFILDHPTIKKSSPDYKDFLSVI